MNPFSTTLEITPDFSKNLFLILILLSFSAVIVVVNLPLNGLIKLIICLIIFAWLVIVSREHCWHLDRAVQTSILRSDDVWFVSIQGEARVKVDLLPGCLVLPWLTVLHFKMPDRGRKSLILLRDNVDKDSFRRLRVRLRFSN